jgi:hypothetical protein
MLNKPMPKREVLNHHQLPVEDQELVLNPQPKPTPGLKLEADQAHQTVAIMLETQQALVATFSEPKPNLLLKPKHKTLLLPLL